MIGLVLAAAVAASPQQCQALSDRMEDLQKYLAESAVGSYGAEVVTYAQMQITMAQIAAGQCPAYVIPVDPTRYFGPALECSNAKSGRSPLDIKTPLPAVCDRKTWQPKG